MHPFCLFCISCWSMWRCSSSVLSTWMWKFPGSAWTISQHMDFWPSLSVRSDGNQAVIKGPRSHGHIIYWYSHYDWSHVSICFNILDIFDVFDIVKHFKFVFQRDSQNLWTAPSTSLTLPLRLIRMKRRSSGKLKIEQKCYGLFLSQKSGPIWQSCQTMNWEVGRESACWGAFSADFIHYIKYNVSAARVVWWIYDRFSKMLLWPSLVESSPFWWVQRHIRICVLDRKIRRGKAKANALTWRRRWQFLRKWIGVPLLFLSSSLEPFGQEYLRLFKISPIFLFCHFCAFAGSCWAWTCCPTMPFQSFFWTTQGFVSPFARSRGARRWASQIEWKRLECAEKHWKLVCRFGRWNVVLKSGLIHRQNARSQQFWGLDSACTNEVQCFGTCRIASRDTVKNGRHLQHFTTITRTWFDVRYCKM